MADTDQISPSLAQLLTSAINARLAELHTGLPAKVVSFDAGTQSCDVQPLLTRIVLDEDEEEVEERMPQITNVPIHYPEGGGWAISWPLKEGDVVFLAFAERSLDRWLESDGSQEIDPELDRKHDISDAIAIPGIRPRTNAISGISTDDFTIARSDGSNPKVVLKPNGNIELVGATLDLKGSMVNVGDGAAQSAMLGDLTNAFLNTLVTFINALTLPVNIQTLTAGPPATPVAPPSGLTSTSVKVKS